MAGEFDKIRTSRGRSMEIADAEQEITGVADEGLTWRLSQAAAAEERSRKIAGGDDAEYEEAENGAKLNKDERGSLNNLLNQIDFAKGSRRTKS